MEVCNSNGEYESICDIGWDGIDAQVVCSSFFGIDFGKLCACNVLQLYVDIHAFDHSI